MNEHSLIFVLLSVVFYYSQEFQDANTGRKHRASHPPKSHWNDRQEGLDGFSMQKLAKAAKVSPATLYIYYKDREDLIMRIAIEITNDLLEASINGFDPRSEEHT